MEQVGNEYGERLYKFLKSMSSGDESQFNFAGVLRFLWVFCINFCFTYKNIGARPSHVAAGSQKYFFL